jgi:hypothetical protein
LENIPTPLPPTFPGEYHPLPFGKGEKYEKKDEKGMRKR